MINSILLLFYEESYRIVKEKSKNNYYKNNIELLYKITNGSRLSHYNIKLNSVLINTIIKIMESNLFYTRFMEENIDNNYVNISYNIGDWVICGKDMDIGIVETITYDEYYKKYGVYIIKSNNSDKIYLHKTYYFLHIYSYATVELIHKIINVNKELKNLFHYNAISKVVSLVITNKTNRKFDWI